MFVIKNVDTEDREFFGWYVKYNPEVGFGLYTINLQDAARFEDKFDAECELDGILKEKIVEVIQDEDGNWKEV